MRKYYLIVFTIFFTHLSIAQTSWESAGTLYSDNGVTVELQYKLKPDSCDPSSTKKSKYQYILSGNLNGSDLYLNWKMDYYACSGLVMCQTNSLNIGKNVTGIIVDPDYFFNGYKIVIPYYDVRISSSPDNTPAFSKGKLQTYNTEKSNSNRIQDKSLDAIIKLKSYIDILKELKILYASDEMMKKHITAILENLSKKINDTLLN